MGYSGLIVASIFAVGILITGYFILFKPTLTLHLCGRIYPVETYYLGAILSPILLLTFQLISFGDIYGILQGSPNFSPLGILALFLAMVFMSLFLDTTGFFHYFALLAIKIAKNSTKALFFSLYLTVAMLTIFTSNDIVILTFTPIIFYFAKTVKINPKPFLFAEFFAANTWSMFLFIGNPTNILLASAFNQKFGEYIIIMFFPTLFAGITSAVVLYLIFRRELDQKFENEGVENPSDVLSDKTGAKLGICILFSTIVLLSVAPYLGLVIWHPAVLMAGILLAYLTFKTVKEVRNKVKEKELIQGTMANNDSIDFQVNTLKKIYKKMPWAVIPFVLSLFITIGALNIYGITLNLAGILSGWASSSLFATVFIFGTLSTLAANILNNIPMSVLFVSLIQGIPIAQTVPALYATIIGSNLGALLTPIGALAGIMWMTMLKGKEFTLSFGEFIKICVLHTPIVLGVSLGVLVLIMAI